MSQCGRLLLLCGKMGAGKSTYARSYADNHKVLLISEDDWLANHYPDAINDFSDYLHYSALIKPQLTSLVQQTLRGGLDVMLDFPANTAKQRAWLKQLAQQVNAPCQLIYLEQTDAQCLENIAKRAQAEPQRAKFDTPQVFAMVNAHFQPPQVSEGIDIVTSIEASLQLSECAASDIEMSLLLEADPDQNAVNVYLHSSLGFVGKVGSKQVAACLLEPQSSTVAELKNIAVQPQQQAHGYGSQLLSFVLNSLREQGFKQVQLSTGTFGHQLGFYQRAGFRVVAVNRNYFIDNYPEPIIENGIVHQDSLTLIAEL